MKLQQYLQAMAYCTIVLGAPLAGATDVGYSGGVQRLRDLELRVDSLESASYNGVSLTGYNGCDTDCGDGCDSSCGASVNCGSSAGKRSSWLRPCPQAQFDTELLLFAASDSEAEAGDTQNDFNAGLRLTYSRVNEQGQIFRVRYFNFGTTLEGGGNRYEMEEIDTEIGRRFTLGGGLRGEFTGGIRYAAFNERNNLDYDTTFGPLVSMQLRGRRFLRGTSFVNLRHSWQFGDASDNGGVDTPGTFKISEVQFGLEWKRQSRLGTLVLRSAVEAQYWSGIQEADTEDIGLYGSATSFGLVF